MRIGFRNISIVFVAIIASLFVARSASAQSYLGNFMSYDVGGNVVTVHADTASLRLVFYKPNIVRVDYLPTPLAVIPRSLIVLPDSNQQVGVTVTNGDSVLTVNTSGLQVVCHKYLTILRDSVKRVKKDPVRVEYSLILSFGS